MRSNADGEDSAVATALEGVVVRGERNLLAESAAPGLAGARAALETFYFAFNTRSLDLYQRIWADDPLVQLASPPAGLIRGNAAIAALAASGFTGAARVQTALEDIVAYATPELVIFAGIERGTFPPDAALATTNEAMPDLPAFHSICAFRFIPAQGGWRQVLHNVSLQDGEQLARFQRALRGA